MKHKSFHRGKKVKLGRSNEEKKRLVVETLFKQGKKRSKEIRSAGVIMSGLV